MRQKYTDWSLVGVAVHSSHYTLPLHRNSWCSRSEGYIFDHAAPTRTGIEAARNSIVTVPVNLPTKSICYKLDVNPVGTPQSVKLLDSEFQRLRPTVQMYYDLKSV